MDNSQNQSDRSDSLRWVVEDAVYVGGYQVQLWFRDGSVKVVDLQEHILQKPEGTVFEELKDQEYFSQVRFDEETSTIVWPNGADLAPEFLYENGVDVTDSFNQQQRKRA